MASWVLRLAVYADLLQMSSNGQWMLVDHWLPTSLMQLADDLLLTFIYLFITYS